MAVNVGNIGVWAGAPVWPDDPNEIGEVAAELEELGYGAAWFGGATADLRLPEQVIAGTSRLVAATGILNVWTEPVDQVSTSFARVNDAAPERLLVGIGAGHAENVEHTGQRYVRPYSKVSEYLRQLDSADRPVPDSARAVAALGPRMVTLAGERSLGAHPYLVTPEHTGSARDILGNGPLLAPEQKVMLERDRDRARAVATPVLETYLGLPNYASNLRRLGFSDDDLAGGGSDRLFDALVAWGDADAVATRIQQHRDAGADHVCVQAITEGGGLPRQQWRELAPALVS